MVSVSVHCHCLSNQDKTGAASLQWRQEKNTYQGGRYEPSSLVTNDPVVLLQDHPLVVKPIMEAIDGVTKSCLATLQLFKDQNLESKSIFEQLGALIDYNQVS